ncbi:MAG: hypothetical protein JRJ00_07740 [Deltaproteobacteria bacterium]|nr:hypothetical protein [Deltaproteobacteria bacterium]
MGNGVMVSRTEAAVRKVCYSHRKPKTTAPVFDSTVNVPHNEDHSHSQIPPWDDDYSDPDYPFEAYM